MQAVHFLLQWLLLRPQASQCLDIFAGGASAVLAAERLWLTLTDWLMHCANVTVVGCEVVERFVTGGTGESTLRYSFFMCLEMMIDYGLI